MLLPQFREKYDNKNFLKKAYLNPQLQTLILTNTKISKHMRPKIRLRKTSQKVT